MEYFIGWVLIGGFVGALIGQTKGRTGDGFLLGALLGIIGWILILAGPDKRNKCPQCRGPVPQGAAKCMHCGSDVTLTKPGHYRPKDTPFLAQAIKQAQELKIRIVTCKCNLCSGNIEFDSDNFDPDNPPAIPCPHCGAETQLYIPSLKGAKA